MIRSRTEKISTSLSMSVIYLFPQESHCESKAPELTACCLTEIIKPKQIRKQY